MGLVQWLVRLVNLVLGLGLAVRGGGGLTWSWTAIIEGVC